jgi:hypothetical protein
VKIGGIHYDKRTGTLGKIVLIKGDDALLTGGIRIGPLCECECHELGKNVMHFMECCQFCYEKYIVDGDVDYEKLYTLASKN